MSTARTCLLALVVCAVGTAAIPYLSCYVYHHDRKISFAEYCDYSESNACITVSARMANDHKFFNASCTRQTQMWLVNYTCCTDSVCNGHADGYQLSNATLNPVELPKAKMADDPEGSGEGAMIEGSGEDENGSGEDDREFGCFVYSSNLGKAREQLCSQGRSRSCVSYNAKLHHDKEQANAYCTDLPCRDIDANFEKQAAQRTVKSIEYTCCSEKYCNAKADSKRVDSPPKNAKAERRQQKLIRTLCSKEERPRWCEDRFPTEPPAPLPVQVAVPFEDQLLSAPQLSLPRPQFAANGVQQQNDFAPWKVLSRHLGDERAPVFFF